MHIIYILSQEAETGPEPCVSGSLIVDLAGEVEKLLIKEVATLMAQAELLCIREGVKKYFTALLFYFFFFLCVCFSSIDIGLVAASDFFFYILFLDLFFLASKVSSVRIDFFL